MTETINTEAATITEGKLGEAVEYVSTRGRRKLAFVTGTPETVIEGTRVSTLAEGQRHLMVVGILTGTGARLNVPSEAQVLADESGEFADFRDAEGSPIGVWRPVA